MAAELGPQHPTPRTPDATSATPRAETPDTLATPKEIITPKQDLVHVKGTLIPKNTDGQDQSALDRLATLAVAAREGGKVLRAELHGDGRTHKLRVTSDIVPPGAKIDANASSDEHPAQDMKWYRVEGKPVPWLMDGEKVPDGDASLPVDRVLSTRPGRPYGIVVEGKTLGTEEIEEIRVKVKEEWKTANGRADKDPDHEYNKKHLTDRYAEIRVGQESGLVNFRIAVGGETEEHAKDLARGIAGAAHSPDKAYTFYPDLGTPYNSADEAIAAATGIDGSTAVFGRVLPIPERDMPGYARVEQSRFSANILGADKIPDERRVEAGTVLDAYGEPGEPFVWDRNRAIEGTIVAGGIRSGKSVFVEKAVAEEIISGEKAGEPVSALIISPKVGDDDYGQRFAAKLATVGKEVVYINVGDPEAPAVRMNPLEPRPGETIEDRQAKVVALFTNAHAASDEYDPEMGRFFAQYLREAVYGYDRDGTHFPSIYEDAGFDVKLNESNYEGGDPKWPNVKDLVRKGMEAGKQKDFAGEGGNTPELWGSYMENITMGVVEEFFGEQGAPIDFAKLGESIVVVKTDKVTDPMQRSIITVSLLDAYVQDGERAKRELPPGTPDRLRRTIVLEEAQSAIPKDSPAATEVDKIIQTGASAGIGVKTIYQNPDKASEVATGNAGSVVVLKLQDGTDVERASKMLGITEEQAQEMMKPTEKGRAMYRGTGTGDAVKVQVNAPDPWPKEPVPLLGPDAIAVKADGEQIPTWTEIRRGEKFLQRTREGRALQLWADTVVTTNTLGLEGIPTLKESNPDLETLKNMRSSDDPESPERRRLDYAIRKTATEAVDSRAPYILKDRSREEYIDYVTGVITAKIDGTENVPDAPPPLEAFTQATKYKAAAYEAIVTSRDLALERAKVEKYIAKAKQHIAQEDTGSEEKAAAEAEVAALTTKATHLDSLLEHHDVFGFSKEDGTVHTYTNHGAYEHIAAIRAQQNQIEDPADLLLPANNGSRIVNRVLPVKINDALSGKVDAWESVYRTALSMFDMPDVTRFALIHETKSVLKDAATERAAERAGSEPVRIEVVEQSVAAMGSLLKEVKEAVQVIGEKVIVHGHQLKEMKPGTEEQGENS